MRHCNEEFYNVQQAYQLIQFTGCNHVRGVECAIPAFI